ncbi:MAG: helix-turn-helix domain-containing protein [Deltaproteobacteria bacterium]|nr:helix-turn-helix domain-containing protein [Deltaproteobacteria bacterium]
MAEKSQKPVMALFGATVSEKRKLMGISQEALAERVGISQESLSRMEKGFIAPRFERLQLFADALTCSISDLFRGQSVAGEWAATMEKIISPLSDCEQREVVAVVTKVVALITARRHTNHDYAVKKIPIP